MDKDLMQRKLLLSSLLNSAGFKVLEEELKSYTEAVEVNQQKFMELPCNDIAGINYINGWRRGLKDLEYILEGFREELEELAGER